MAVIVVAKPSEEATTSGMPFVANVADDAEVREIVVRVGRYGSLRLSFNEAQNMQRDLLLAVSREGLLGVRERQNETLPAWVSRPYVWKQCDRCRHLRKTLDGICGNCADDLRADAQVVDAMDPG